MIYCIKEKEIMLKHQFFTVNNLGVHSQKQSRSQLVWGGFLISNYDIPFVHLRPARGYQ